MKLIVAIIQPQKFEEVHQALINKDISRITVSRVTGHGRAEDFDLYRGQQVTPDLIPKVRLEIAVNDDFVDVTVKTILTTARSNGGGKIGDGKIFILPLENCIRIRTGEDGGEAI